MTETLSDSALGSQGQPSDQPRGSYHCWLKDKESQTALPWSGCGLTVCPKRFMCQRLALLGGGVTFKTRGLMGGP
jgi:hypothetical protein